MKDSGIIPENLKNFPVGETTKALIRVTPFDYRDPWFKTGFDLYHHLQSGMELMIGFLILAKIAYHAFRLDPVNKIGELFRNGITSILFLNFFPHFFEKISLLIQGLQDKILDFKMTQAALHQATFNSSYNFIKVILVLALTQFAGFIGWIFGAMVALCWFLPLLIYELYYYAFRLGIATLIYTAPVVFVLGPILGLGITIPILFWMLIGSMLWPIYWTGIGRVAFQAMGEMNILQAFGFTLIVGFFQVIIPIKIIRAMRGVNPVESSLSLLGGVAKGAATVATALPLGAVGAPLIGMASGVRSYFSGARLGTESASSSSGVSFAGRMMAGFQAHQKVDQFQSETGMSGSGQSGFQRAVHRLGRTGVHLNRARSALRGVHSHQNQKVSSSSQGGGETTPLYENPSVHGLNLKDLSRYGMIRSSEKQAQRWHYGTLAFLSGGRSSSGSQKPKGSGQLESIRSSSPASKSLGFRGKEPALLEHGGFSGPKENPVIHLGGELHPSPKAPRRIPIDPNRKKNTPWLEKNSKHFDFKETSFSMSTSSGIEPVRGYTAYSKKTGQVKAYFVPRNRFQEAQALEKSQMKEIL
jgi:hypothetical protein